MKATDIIRSILDLIDDIDGPQPVATAEIIASAPADDMNHFKQIIDLVSQSGQYTTAPDEHYADIDSVTVNAGGGINGPKHPTDIRVKDISAYPEYKDEQFENSANDKQVQHKRLIDYLNDRGN
jgi:hypothetical protein